MLFYGTGVVYWQNYVSLYHPDEIEIGKIDEFSIPGKFFF